MGDIYGSNFFFAHFENSNFGQFAIFLANLRYFWPWRSSEGPKGPDLVPTATGWSDWVNYIHIMCSGPLWDLYGTPGASKRAHFGPERPFWEPRRSSVGPGGSDLVPTAAVWSTWVGLMATTHFGLVSGLFRAPGGSKRAPFGPKCPFSAKLRPLAATIRPNINPKCVVTMSLTQADQLAAVGTKSGPLGPSDDLRGLQKGHFGPKRALLGAQKRPDTRPKCVVTMITSLSDQSAAVGTNSGPPGPTEDLRGHQKGLSGPK